MSHEQPSLFEPGAATSVRRTPFPWINVLLFLATGASTLFFGTYMMIGFRAESGASSAAVRSILETPSLLFGGIPFAASLMAILLAHEMGHYLTCRRYRISATLPYFIPAPNFVGTFGAFIRILSPFQHRAALLEVGVAGPIAGFVLAVPILAFALTRSRFVPSEAADGFINLGEPLIFSLVASLVSVQAPEGMELFLHPMGFAAWVGFLVTALNLIPVGQLDGGHIAYAMFRGSHRRVSQLLVFVLFPLGVFFWLGWLVWAVLLVLLGTRHPPTLDDDAPLDARQIALGWIGLILLVLCFMPAPLTIG